METPAAGPHLPDHKIELLHHDTGRASSKFNKYLMIIIVLAIIAAAIFYFKPAAQPSSSNLTEQEKVIPPAENITPAEAPKLETIPGLSIRNLNVLDSLADGSPFSLSFVANNTGNASIDSVLITAEIDSSQIYNKTLEKFEVNASQTLGFTLLSKDAGYPAVGAHTVNILANGKLLATHDFEVTARVFAPDLEIRSFVVRPEFGVTVGKNVSVVVYVRNIGNADAANASIKIFASDSLLLENSFDLQVQTTKTFETIWIPSEAGTYYINTITSAPDEAYTDTNKYGFNVTVTNSTG